MHHIARSSPKRLISTTRDLPNATHWNRDVYALHSESSLPVFEVPHRTPLHSVPQIACCVRRRRATALTSAPTTRASAGRAFDRWTRGHVVPVRRLHRRRDQRERAGAEEHGAARSRHHPISAPRSRRHVPHQRSARFIAIVAGRCPVLVPVFGAPTKTALQDMPQDIAGAAVVMRGRLAAGYSAAWRGIKQAKDMPHQVLMARVGIHHRLLFRADEGQGASRGARSGANLDRATPAQHGRNRGWRRRPARTHSLAARQFAARRSWASSGRRPTARE